MSVRITARVVDRGGKEGFSRSMEVIERDQGTELAICPRMTPFVDLFLLVCCSFLSVLGFVFSFSCLESIFFSHPSSYPHYGSCHWLFTCPDAEGFVYGTFEEEVRMRVVGKSCRSGGGGGWTRSVVILNLMCLFWTFSKWAFSVLGEEFVRKPRKKSIVCSFCDVGY